MPDPHRPNGDLTGKVTAAAVVAAIACCAIPLLITAGLITSAGLAVRNLAIIGLGIALAAWLVVRAVRSTASGKTSKRRHHPPATPHTKSPQQGGITVHDLVTDERQRSTPHLTTTPLEGATRNDRSSS